MNSEQLTVRKISEMREVARSSVASAKGDAYSRQRTSLRAQRAAYYVVHRPGMNITILPEYRLGKEYPKTYGHFHQPDSEETYKVLLGEAGILLQKGVDPVEEIKLVKLKKDDSFTVPKGYAHTLINLGKGPVATLDDHDPAKTRNTYNPIREKRGFAYYLTEEKRKFKVTPNPSYTKVPPLKLS